MATTSHPPSLLPSRHHHRCCTQHRGRPLPLRRHHDESCPAHRCSGSACVSVRCSPQPPVLFFVLLLSSCCCSMMSRSSLLWCGRRCPQVLFRFASTRLHLHPSPPVSPLPPLLHLPSPPRCLPPPLSLWLQSDADVLSAAIHVAVSAVFVVYCSTLSFSFLLCREAACSHSACVLQQAEEADADYHAAVRQDGSSGRTDCCRAAG